MESLNNDIEGKTVLVRADLNVPLKDGKVANSQRIERSLPTIKFLTERNCRVAACSHLGRPKGKVVDELRMDPVAKELSRLLGKEVRKLDNCIGVEEEIAQMNPGEVVVLENTRFHPEEKENDAEFSKYMAAPFDAFVFDAFGTAHRAHASTKGVQEFLPSYLGLLVEDELDNINRILKSTEIPFILVLGGKKISDKVGVIKHMSQRADKILIGGAMAFPFFKADGLSTGSSYLEEESVKIASKLSREKLVLPVDFLIGDLDSDTAEAVGFDKIPAGKMGLDIGPKTIELFKQELQGAASIVWNGPMGLFENPTFSIGTREMALAVSQAKESLLGGGDTIAALDKLEIPIENYTHVSTGGGVLLRLLEGKSLVALE